MITKKIKATEESMPWYCVYCEEEFDSEEKLNKHECKEKN